MVEKAAQVSEVRHFYSPIVLRQSTSFRPFKSVQCYTFGALWSTTIRYASSLSLVSGATDDDC